MTTVEVFEQVVAVVEISETEAVLQTSETVQVVELGIAGPQGATGSTGATGPAGPQGPSGSPGAGPQAFEYVQAVPAATWTITHNLGFRPQVFVEDTLGRDVEGDISHTSINELVLTFSAAFSGAAYLS